MKQKFYSLLLIALFGMTGMNAWSQDLSTTEIDGITYYQIGSAADLVAFANLVNGDADTETPGQFDANAILTADINLTDVDWTPIGTNGGAFTGIFDGQGHKVTGLEGISLGKYGLLGYIQNATVKNFSISGTIEATAAHGTGAIGWSESSSISNVHSSLVIEVTQPDVHHVGGVVGSAQYHNRITGCTFSGSVTELAGNTDNFAGIAGYMAEDTLTFCANYGTITFAAINCSVGGIAGYLNNTGGVVKGCLNMGSIVYSEEGTPTNGGAIIGRQNNGYTIANFQGNRWLESSTHTAFGGKTLPESAAASFTEDQLPTGEVCYGLNGDQSVIGWYQTLNADEAPTLDATHAQVYMIGHKHCDGTLYDGATFTNESVEVIQDEHDIADGFCTYCNLWFADFFTPNADGFYEIANAKQLAWFEMLVNKGTLDANAILTADIDFADLMSEEDKEDIENAQIEWTPIGDWGQTRGTSNAGYQGHFDGQGHTIKNLNATSKQNYFGLFGVISTGCLIENFDIYGTYYTKYQYVGSAAAYARDSYPTIRNVHSFVNINNSYAGGRQGGILGGVLTTVDKTIIENCTYSGTLDGNDAGGSGNYGGIVGYVNNNSKTVADITNCLFDGEVVNNNATPGGCTFGGFVGYSNGGVVTIKNSLSIGTVRSAIYGMFFGAVKSTKSSLPNSYYIGSPLNGSASTVTLTATETNEDELASGEIAWKLNEETFLDVVWRQNIYEDKYPVPDGNGAVVYQTPTGYDCISEDDPDSFDSFISNVIANEEEFLYDLVAYQALIDEYKETIESWKDINTYEEFLAAYKAAAELKESIRKSVATYAKYVEACEYASNYLTENKLEGEWVDFLKAYLDEDTTIEPNSSYPNGNYAYIMDELNLDDEALTDEIDFVNQMLANAIAGGLTSGTEITRLLINPAFTDGLEGWTIENEGGTPKVGGDTYILPVSEAYNNKSFNAYQTLNELPNGIYVTNINGLFRAGDDYYNNFYAGQLYLNSTVNYFMAPGEDVLSDDEVESYNNVFTSYDDGVGGWVPNSLNACSYAFSADHYQNFTATEVTDGNLTVGVRNQGTGLSKDWLPFADVRVWYLGTAEEANDKLADVLLGYVKRAQVIVDFDWSSDSEDVNKYPNMSEELKSKLSDAIEETAFEESVAADGEIDMAAFTNATTGEEKMKLINKFSELFNEVLACRKAYIELFNIAQTATDFFNILADYELIDFNEFNEMSGEAEDAVAHYMDGDVSTEEALAIIEKLNAMCLILSPDEDGVYQLATADEVKRFSILVNSNIAPSAKAVLAADIDMSEIEYMEPIGSSSQPFTGEFDGQGFKITGFGQYIEEDGDGYYTLELSGDKQGFFGYVKNATIKNFSIDGAFTYDGGTGYGAIGWAEGSTLINIHSTLNIASVSTSHHIGGVCGDMRAGSKAYNCSFSGTITDSHSTHDCIGGIGGYSNENCRYENCANYGTIEFSASNAYASGICGYVNNDSFVGVFNCLNVGDIMMIDGSSPSYSGAIIGRLRNHANSKFDNNYWLQGSAARAYGENSADATTVNADQLKSGEICYKLNGDQTEINWFQTLGDDTYPVLDDTHKTVYLADDGSYVNEKTNTPDGSKENPFVVKSAADLSNLLNLLVSGRMNYVVMEADVDMTGVTDWTPLFNYANSTEECKYPIIDFDGKGHVISNLSSKTDGAYDYCGLFGVLCGNVRNLGIENADVTCAGGTGIIAGYLGHSSYGQPCYVENVWVTGKITASGYCGGMFGNVSDEAHIYNCYANVEVNGSTDLTGGIIGRVRNRVEMIQVYAAGSINRGGGIIGGGFQDATPLGTYKHVAVWNNTTGNFGPVRENEDLHMILYYDGTNFADLQSQVVAWDPKVWSCDMLPGSYPVLAAFDPDGIKEVNAQWSMDNNQTIFNLAGQRISKMQKGVNIVNGKKVMVK